MSRIVFNLSILLLFISCNRVEQKEVYIPEPKLSPVENYSTETFDEPFFSENHYGYAQFMKFDSSGKLTYQYPGGLNNQFVDSTKYYHSAEVILQIDTSTYYFRNCTATKNADTIALSFSDNPFSRNHYELKAWKDKSSVSFQYNQNFTITDSSYRPSIYSVVNPGLIFDKKEYAKSDRMKGKLHVTVIGNHTWPKVYTDTAIIYGLFKTVIE